MACKAKSQTRFVSAESQDNSQASLRCTEEYEAPPSIQEDKHAVKENLSVQLLSVQLM